MPVSNINLIVQKLGQIASQKMEQIKEFFKRNDPQGTGKLEYDLFRLVRSILYLIKTYQRKCYVQDVYSMLNWFYPKMFLKM